MLLRPFRTFRLRRIVTLNPAIYVLPVRFPRPRPGRAVKDPRAVSPLPIQSGGSRRSSPLGRAPRLLLLAVESARVPPRAPAASGHGLEPGRPVPDGTQAGSGAGRVRGGRRAGRRAGSGLLSPAARVRVHGGQARDHCVHCGQTTAAAASLRPAGEWRELSPADSATSGRAQAAARSAPVSREQVAQSVHDAWFCRIGGFDAVGTLIEALRWPACRGLTGPVGCFRLRTELSAMVGHRPRRWQFGRSGSCG